MFDAQVFHQSQRQHKDGTCQGSDHATTGRGPQCARLLALTALGVIVSFPIKHTAESGRGRLVSAGRCEAGQDIVTEDYDAGRAVCRWKATLG